MSLSRLILNVSVYFVPLLKVIRFISITSRTNCPSLLLNDFPSRFSHVLFSLLWLCPWQTSVRPFVSSRRLQTVCFEPRSDISQVTLLLPNAPLRRFLDVPRWASVNSASEPDTCPLSSLCPLCVLTSVLHELTWHVSVWDPVEAFLHRKHNNHDHGKHGLLSVISTSHNIPDHKINQAFHTSGCWLLFCFLF